MNRRLQQISDLWQRATRALTVAERDLTSGDPDFAAARSYYAVFYAASALLLSDDRRFRRHSGVIASFHRYYVKEGRVPREAGRTLIRLHDLRDLADYGGSQHVTMADAQQAVADARRFLDLVQPLLPLEQPSE
ncbi:MAG: HEPN domain-containing protein [Planctomycetes bacterium]|nr:HEPN domain-containing protein [Planctomycetota bacterium]